MTPRDPASGSPSGRAARTGRPAVAPAPRGAAAGGKTSPQPSERQAARIPSPVTGAGSPSLGSAPGRGRAQAIPGVNEVHEGDCLDLLPALPDGCAQLVIADPPYNLGPTFGNGAEWVNDPGWLDWCGKWLAECQRILTDDGNLFVYGIHHYLCYLQVRLYEIGMTYRRQIIWHYQNGFTTYRNNLATHYEPVLWFANRPGSYYREIREPYKSTERLQHPVIKNGKTWTPHPDGRLAGDVWEFPVLAGRRFADEKVDHPTQKPLALTDRIVCHFSEPGALVVAPFAGSGTECVSATRNGRDYWGSEIKPEYVQLALRRIQAALDTPALFGAP